MAYTVTKHNSVFGNKKTIGMEITADGATQAVETGLKWIEFMSVGPSSMNSSNIHIATNSNCSGVSTPGTIGITGCTSGDNFYVTVFGR